MEGTAQRQTHISCFIYNEMKYTRVTVVTHLVGSVSYKATEMGWGSLMSLSEQEGGASPGQLVMTWSGLLLSRPTSGTNILSCDF